MRQWSHHRQGTPQAYTEGQELLSYIYMQEGRLVREDKVLVDSNLDIDSQTLQALGLPAGVLGWWRSTVRRRPPTQKELNERLERLLLSTHEVAGAQKGALQWMLCLYLARKRIVRQESASSFTHIKSGQRYEIDPSATDGTQMQAAIAELIAVIS